MDFYFFGCQLGYPEPKKSSPHCRESTIFQKIAFRKWHRFLIEILSNPPQNRSQDASNFWSIFASIISPFWLHLGTQVGAMLATFWAKNGGSVACSRPFCFYGVFFPLFGPPGHLLGPIWGPFWQVFGFILAQFWRTSWPFLGSFSKPGAHTNPKLLDGSLCRRPFACRAHGGGNAACRAKDKKLNKKLKKNV